MAGIALLLACTGIYAVTTYSVVQRTSELGIRTALGAQSRELLRWFCAKACFRSRSASPSACIISSAYASALHTALRSASYRCADLRGRRLPAFSRSFDCLGLPARRTMRVDPMVALRYE